MDDNGAITYKHTVAHFYHWLTMMFTPSWLQWENAMLIFSLDILISQVYYRSL